MRLADLEFLAPWCAFMKNLVDDTDSEIIVSRWGPEYGAAIQFSVEFPKLVAGSLAERELRLKILREGLSLFAAIAWINAETLISLLSLCTCHPPQVWENHELDVEELPVFVELKISSEGISTTDLRWMEDMLVSTCCSLGSHNTSHGFQEAWRKLELMAHSSVSPALRGVDIPVRLRIDDCDTKKGEAVLRRAWDVIRDTLDSDQVCWGWASLSFGMATSRSRGGYYSSFLLDSISARNTPTTFRSSQSRGEHTINVKFAELVNEISGHVQFSTLPIRLLNGQETQAASESTCRMVSGLLSRDTCIAPTKPTRCTTNCIKMEFHDRFMWELKAFCAAIAVTRSCQSVHIMPSWTYSTDGATRAAVWQWLAYALFSKRARSRSSVSRMKLTEVDLKIEDVKAIAKVLANDSPVPDHASINDQVQAQDEREYHVNESATVRVNGIVGRTGAVESSEVLRGRRVCGVKIIGDDGRREWVDAIVPGVGLCALQRRSLAPCNHVPAAKETPRKMLELGFAYSSGAAEGLPQLLHLVGSYLQSLRLTFSSVHLTRVLDPFWIIASCPHLLELSVRNRRLSAINFVRACEGNGFHVRHLEAAFDELRVVANTLCDASHSLSRHLQWWDCPLVCYHESLPLQPMLASNRSLEYLTVRVLHFSDYQMIRDNLSCHDGEELQAKKELQMDCRLAFLSVINRSEPPPAKKQAHGQRLRLQPPDRDTTSMIFEFVEERAVRKVRTTYGWNK